MALDFPSAPALDQLFPSSPIAGVPTYKWDGEKWVSQNIVAVLDAPVDNQLYGRSNSLWVPAAPASAIAWSGLQINGSGQVDQIGYGVTSVSTSTSYFSDLWQVAGSSAGAVFNVGQIATPFNPVAFPWAFDKSFRLSAPTRVTAVGAGDYVFLSHVIEGYRTAPLGLGRAADAQPISVGFWCWADAAGTASVCLRNSSNRSCPKNFTLAARTPKWVTLTFPPCPDGTWPTDNTIGLRIEFVFQVGTTYQAAEGVWAANGSSLGTPANTNSFFLATNNAVFVTGLIVLPGYQVPTAAQTPNILRGYTQEYLDCKRYYHSIQNGVFFAPGHCRGSSGFYLTMHFPTPMRANPTMPYPGDTKLWSGDNSAAFASLVISLANGRTDATLNGSTNTALGALGDACAIYSPSSPFPFDARM